MAYSRCTISEGGIIPLLVGNLLLPRGIPFRFCGSGFASLLSGKAKAMRVLFGIIVGIFLTIGGAYLYDSVREVDPAAPAAANRPMVNWQVVDSNWQRLTNRMRREWDKLAAK